MFLKFKDFDLNIINRILKIVNSIITSLLNY